MSPALTLPGAKAPASTNAQAAAAGTGNAPTNQGGQNTQAAPQIPFTRSSPQKSKQAPAIGPSALQSGNLVNFGPWQVPSGGFFRRLRLNVACVAVNTGTPATVAFNADGPFNVLQQIGLLSASGGQIIYSIDGYLLYAWNKYGCLDETAPQTDPKADITYSAVVGAGATGGSFNFNISIPLEIDSRDALGCLPNMAGNQLFQLNGQLNTLGNVYTTAPFVSATVTVTPIYEFWALPDASNTDGIAQAQFPPGIGTALLIQNQNPVITPSVQQKIQLTNVGNIHRMYLMILRRSTLARDASNANWPNVVTRYVNGNPFNYKTVTNWLSEQGKRYALNYAGGSTYETTNGFDQGVFVWSDFIKDGDGNELASAACNRNEWLVTERSSVLEFDYNAWGAAASTLLISTLSVTTPSPSALYQPYVG